MNKEKEIKTRSDFEAELLARGYHTVSSNILNSDEDDERVSLYKMMDEKKIKKRIKAVKKFKKNFSEVISEKTNYYTDEGSYDAYIIWLLHKGKDSFDDDLAFSVQVNEKGTGLESVNLCLEDIIGDRPAVFATNKKDLKDMIKALKVVSKYLQD